MMGGLVEEGEPREAENCAGGEERGHAAVGDGV